MSTVIKRIDVVSAGKVTAIIAAVIGFIYGVFLAILSLLFSGLVSSIGSLASLPTGSLPSGVLPAGALSLPSLPTGLGSIFGLIGILAIVILPILFAIVGFIVGVVGAAIYNVIAARLGGIEVETAERTVTETQPSKGQK